MKQKIGIVAAVLLVALLGTSLVCAAPATPKWVAYDYTTQVEPPPEFEEGTGSSPMSYYCKIEDGALVLNTMSDPKAGPTYKLRISTPKPGFKMTVVTRAKVNGEFGMDFDFRTGVRERVQLLGSGISLNTSKINDTTVKTTDWHTYFITFEVINDGGVKLVTKIYVDGATNPVVQGTSNTTDTSGYFRFGDGSGNSGYMGSIDWFMYTFDGAFSPDQVNLPSGFSLK